MHIILILLCQFIICSSAATIISMTSGNLWNYHRDLVNDDANEIYYRVNNKNKMKSTSFEYKTIITGNAPADNNTLETDAVVSLQYLSNLWRSLDLLLINCKIELDLLLNYNI